MGDEGRLGTSDPPTAAVFKRLTYGVCVVGAAYAGKQDAFTAAWVMQVSFDPLLLALSINPSNASYALVIAANAFAVSVLARDQLQIARHFGTASGRDTDKMRAYEWRPARTGSPILADALAYLDCELTARHRTGDHELLIGHVVDGALSSASAVPMSYADTGDLDGSSALYPATF